MVYRTNYTHPGFGEITIASDGQNIVGLWMAGQKHFGGTVDGEMEPADDLPVFTQAKGWLDRYFAGERPAIDELPLAPNGSSFRQRVWRKLAEIPYGQVRTYGDLAREIAQEDGKEKMSSQAVGGAVGHNPISIIIPCHRVVGSGGSLTGYAGGLARKIWLLEHEGVDMEGRVRPREGHGALAQGRESRPHALLDRVPPRRAGRPHHSERWRGDRRPVDRGAEILRRQGGGKLGAPRRPSRVRL